MRDPVWANTFEDRSGNVTQHANFLCICFPICDGRMCVPCLLLRANCCFSLREVTAAPSIIAQRQCSKGGRATFEAAYVSCRIYDHPRRQSMSVTSAKCRDVRGQAVYDRAAQCGPSIGFHLASQMFPTTASKWALERENGLFERDIDQCYIYYFLKSFWAWCPEINSSNQFGHLVSYHCAFYSVQWCRTDGQKGKAGKNKKIIVIVTQGIDI